MKARACAMLECQFLEQSRMVLDVRDFLELGILSRKYHSLNNTEKLKFQFDESLNINSSFNFMKA